jgi:hypothetical protein
VRRIAAAGLVAVALALLALAYRGGSEDPVAAPAGTPRAAIDAAPGPTSDAASPLTLAVRQGAALRIAAPAGPIHVWRPAGYRPETAATVVYVHGYYTDVDTAWRDHQLPEQFASSAVNAVFIAPEAPNGLRQLVQFRDLGELLRTVEDALGEPRPSGPLIVVGHSGAYRTLLAWLDYPPIDTVILVDALYGDFDEFRDWLLAGAARRLVTIGDDTVRWTEDYARAIAGTVEVDRVPPGPETGLDFWPPEARTARHLYVRSQIGHMGQVTGGVLLPMLLRLEAVELLGSAPWTHPLGELPALPDAAPARRGRR